MKKKSATTDEKIEALLNKARAGAIEAMHGFKATPSNLEQLANNIYDRILMQAYIGDWKWLGVDGIDGLSTLLVTCVAQFGKIHVQYDFTKTKIPMVKAWTQRSLVS